MSPISVWGILYNYRLEDYYLFFQLLGYKIKHHVVRRRSVVIWGRKYNNELGNQEVKK